MPNPPPRRTLSLRSLSPQERVEEARKLILQAIDQGLCLRWTYNRTAMRVAPQILYPSKGELYVDAIAVEKNGVAPYELKLGRFLLSGLSGVAITTEELTPVETIDLDSPRYREGVLAQASS